MLFKDLSGTSLVMTSTCLKDIWVGITGAGTVALEFLSEDGTWDSYPESTFTAPTAQVVTVKKGKYRFNVTGGPATIEVGE